MDGTEIEYEDADKDVIISTTEWNEEKNAIVEKMKKGDDHKEYTTTRYMEDGEMKQKIVNKAGVSCIRVYKKKVSKADL